jgi:hypothetical protein
MPLLSSCLCSLHASCSPPASALTLPLLSLCLCSQPASALPLPLLSPCLCSHPAALRSVCLCMSPSLPRLSLCSHPASKPTCLASTRAYKVSTTALSDTHDTGKRDADVRPLATSFGIMRPSPPPLPQKFLGINRYCPMSNRPSPVLMYVLTPILTRDSPSPGLQVCALLRALLSLCTLRIRVPLL